MYHFVAEFEKDWTYESGATLKLLDLLTDAALAHEVCEGHRSIGRIAWHIITTIPEMMGQTGLKLPAVDAKASVPTTAKEISKAYREVSQEVLVQIKADWDDATLEVEDNLYGENWKRGNTLSVLMKHEIHHRGQMMVLMRQAGLTVAGPYGPAKEEWATHKQPPPAV